MIESKNDTSRNLEKALQALKQAQQRVANEKIKSTAVSVKNEVMEMIAKVKERKGRLDLPIVSEST